MQQIIRQEALFIGLGALAAIVFAVLLMRFGFFSGLEPNDIIFAISLMPVGIVIVTTMLGSSIVYLLLGESPRSLQFKNVNFLILIDRVMDSGPYWKVFAGNAYYLLRATTFFLVGWVLVSLVLTGHLLFK